MSGRKSKEIRLARRRKGIPTRNDFVMAETEVLGPGPGQVLVRNVYPKALKCIFENVGGAHFDAALSNMRLHGRIPVCGMIAQSTTPLRLPDRQTLPM